MKIDATGIKEAIGLVEGIKGVPTFYIKITELKIGDAAKVSGINIGKQTLVWLACLKILKGKSREAMQRLNTLLLNKEVILVPDSMKPNKHGHINAHVSIKKTGQYVNRLLLAEGLVAKDNLMMSSKQCEELRGL
jgi:hypothetical protein